MESDLKFSVEDGKHILTDVSSYTDEGLKGLHNTFSATLELKKKQIEQLSKQLTQVSEELDITTKRFKQLEDHMISSGVEIPKEEQND